MESTSRFCRKKAGETRESYKRTKRKLEKFIYKLYQYLPHRKLIWLHQQILQLDEVKLAEYAESPKNPYQIFFGWVVEVFQYGLCSLFIYATFAWFDGWLKLACLPFAIGIVRWLWLDIVKETRRAK